MSAIDDVIRKHADDLLRLYDERTAGDYTFTGALAMFLLDAQPLIEQVAEERGAARVRERLQLVVARCNVHAAKACGEEWDACNDDEAEAFADAAMWIAAALRADA